MKRPLPLLLIVSLISALAGAGLACIESVERTRQVATAEASAILAKQRKAKETALQLAAWVYSADEAVFVSYVGGKKELRVSDPNWIKQLSAVLGRGACEPTATGLWVSSPEVELCRGGKPVITLMLSGNYLRVLDGMHAHDFVIEPESAASLAALEHQIVHS